MCNFKALVSGLFLLVDTKIIYLYNVVIVKELGYMMFINLTCRKANGDFYVTSSEVEKEKHPELNEFNMRLYMLGLASEYFGRGFDVTLTQRKFD